MGVPARRWSTRTDLLKQLEIAKSWLDGAPLDKVNVKAAAKHAGLSLHHFIRLFGESYGLTPHRYVTARRIECAKVLLAEGARSVGEVATEVGFGNQSAFSRLFRAHVGQTPKAYRASCRLSS